MTDARPFTVVCVADDSRSTERVDLVENTFVAFVMAENVSEAMAAGQVHPMVAMITARFLGVLGVSHLGGYDTKSAMRGWDMLMWRQFRRRSGLAARQ